MSSIQTRMRIIVDGAPLYDIENINTIAEALALPEVSLPTVIKSVVFEVKRFHVAKRRKGLKETTVRYITPIRPLTMA